MAEKTTKRLHIAGILGGPGGVTDEQVADAVEEYFEQNPIEKPKDSGYYRIEASIINGNVLRIDHKASNTDMVGLPTQLITLPTASGSGVSSWNDLTDRPFGEEGSQVVIEWDGVTEGRTQIVIDGEPIPYYKVSDLTPSLNDVIGGYVNVANADTLVIGPEHVMEQTDDFFNVMAFMVFYKTSITIGDSVITIPSTGIYALKNGDYHISKISYGPTVKTLDEKYIPDTIARISDIPEGSAGVTSWNDLTDKPFGEEGQTIKTLEEKFIPDIIARKSDVTWANLTDKPFGEEGQTIKTLDEKFIPDTIARVEDMPDGVTSWNDLTDKPFGEEGQTIKTLDEKYIPDTIVRKSDIPEPRENADLTISVDGTEVTYNGDTAVSADISTAKNWEQNDTTAPDYIHGRTHYEVTYISKIVEKTGNIAQNYEYPNCIRTLRYADPTVRHCLEVESDGSIVFKLDLTQGDLRDIGKVDSDGVKDDDGQYDCTYFGNGHLYLSEFEDTGEDWCICVMRYTGTTGKQECAIVLPQSYSNATLRFYVRSVTELKKLDEKFIPDTIARVSDIPQGGSGGLSTTAAALLLDILRSAVFTTNVTGKIAALEAALAGGGNSGGDTPDIPDSPDDPVADDITVSDGVMTITTVGSEITVSDGVMTIE